MNIMERKRISIPLDQLENVEDMFYRQIAMDKDKALKRFEQRINETKDLVYSNINIKAVYKSFPLARIEGDLIIMENGKEIENGMLAKVFEKSHEVVLSAISVFGYDELEDNAEDTLTAIFIDGWGTAIAECASIWLRKQIKEEAMGSNLHTTHSWSPGQHGVDIQLQKLLFELIDPEEMGTSLSKTYMMSPKKSVSGMIGLGHEEDKLSIRACDFCHLRETCPSAYAS